MFGDPIDIGFLGLFSDVKRTSGAAFFVDTFRFHHRDQQIGFRAYPRFRYPHQAQIIIRQKKNTKTSLRVIRGKGLRNLLRCSDLAFRKD
jgi:hypothetical protein